MRIISVPAPITFILKPQNAGKRQMENEDKMQTSPYP